MLNTLELDYVQHLERGYCVNHPDVIAETKEQVVDRAVKQLLEALQALPVEIWFSGIQVGANGYLGYIDDVWQYSNDGGGTWHEIGSGGGSSALPAIHNLAESGGIPSAQMAGDLYNLTAEDLALTLPAISTVTVGANFWVKSVKTGYSSKLTPGEDDEIEIPGLSGGVAGQPILLGANATPGSLWLVAGDTGTWIAFSVSGDVTWGIPPGGN